MIYTLRALNIEYKPGVSRAYILLQNKEKSDIYIYRILFKVKLKILIYNLRALNIEYKPRDILGFIFLSEILISHPLPNTSIHIK
ncbi:MAG: hypothetical protein ACD_2C00047G0008 [uncultured bacterium (gcode 4)]|uniref:Uncharacterized protein n=1 Tax=uncultured bacterium (gcode 4) TaxID=1234023 RepID=K2G6Y3_9BACT|nr:MAG: hypothetical protein ACD_2C00047G0008 [uncultured bacterium (gcode 4)]